MSVGLAKDAKKLFKFLRQGSFKGHFLARARMDKGKTLGVQTLPVKEMCVPLFKGACPAAVDRIAEQRVSERRHVYADLMGSSGLKPQGEIADLPKALSDRIMRDGRARGMSVADDRHAFAVGRMPPDRKIHPSRIA